MVRMRVDSPLPRTLVFQERQNLGAEVMFLILFPCHFHFATETSLSAARTNARWT